ncbi:uncharacterized protein LOC100903848 [Galendromus occidentalis]|uniref:Uncharacterized protein LOC100903848 n=1 Tax=Galendromus occidentalis TaxID=34638 RepID=A0AAJ6QVL5_9ACAR|nr:uncharacterized protein LOC100903848 [Galendromus occidentalis]
MYASTSGSTPRNVVYTIADEGEIGGELVAIESPQGTPQKLLLSNVVSVAASRVRGESQRGCDSLYCESCHSRLQKLDEMDLKQTELEMMLQIYQKKLDFSKRLLDEYHLKEKPFLNNITKIFNGDQIVRILTGHCLKRRGGSSWDDATLKKAAKLYFLCSPQGYQEILSLKLPLPSSHTLQNVIQKGRSQPLNPKLTTFNPFTANDVTYSISVTRKNLQRQKQVVTPKNPAETKQERGYAEKISRLSKANDSTLSQNLGLVISHADVSRLVNEEEEENDEVQGVELEEGNETQVRDNSVDRAVGAVVRSMVDQVVKNVTTRPRGPYVSILRNPNDPNAPARYNLVMPRHMLKPGQRFVLKHPAPGQTTSTVQIISHAVKRLPAPAARQAIIKRARLTDDS